MSRSYYEIAMDDRMWAKAVLPQAREKKYYNQIIFHFQQCVEKYLKGYIIENLNYKGKYDSQLKTHNLRLLVNIINNEMNTNLDPVKAKYLGDFYFDARYPGDNYEYITDERVMEECMSICDDIILEMELLINE